MRWSKVRKLVRETFADSVRDRVDVLVTNADPRGSSRVKRVRSRSIESSSRTSTPTACKLTLSLPIAGEPGHDRHVVLVVQPRPEQEAPPETVVGEFLDFPQACWEYLHSSVNESLESADPFVSSLAVLNAKVGRQRLRRMMNGDLHPLTRAMLDFRMDAEQQARGRSMAQVS